MQYVWQLCKNYVVVYEKNLTKEELIRRENNFKCNECKSVQKKLLKNLKDHSINILSDNDDKNCDDMIDEDNNINGGRNGRYNKTDRTIDADDEDAEADIGIDGDIEDEMDNEDVDLG